MNTTVNTKYWVNGQNSSEENYKDGKKEGVWTKSYMNGQKWEEVNFKNGKVID